MKQVLFSNNFETLNQSEIKKLTKKSWLIHILLSYRMNELFQVNNIKLGEARTKEYTYYYCDKLILKDKSRNYFIIAYVQDEKDEIYVMTTKSEHRIVITKQ